MVHPPEAPPREAAAPAPPRPAPPPRGHNGWMANVLPPSLLPGRAEPPWTHVWLQQFSLILRFALVLVQVSQLIFAITFSLHRMFPKRAAATQPGTFHHEGAIARSDQLQGKGRIYLVQLGAEPVDYHVVDLAASLRETYGLDVRILNSEPLERATEDSARHQRVAERLVAQMERANPALARDPEAYLIGFTSDPMYADSIGVPELFSYRDQQRAAVISSHLLGLNGSQRWFKSSWELNYADEHMEPQLRRILLKDVAVLFWHLPLNADPESVLYFNLDPSLPDENLYVSDLDPAQSGSGLYLTNPCLVLRSKAATGLVGSPVEECSEPESPGGTQAGVAGAAVPDTAEERMELRLRLGFPTEKHTDFFLPGAPPIRLERALSNRWEMPQAFGISGSHNYDDELITFDAMQHISVNSAGAQGVTLARSPAWLRNILFARWTAPDQPGGLTLRWRTTPAGHFELTRSDGEVESYLGCAGSESCFLNGDRDPAGRTLVFARDAERRLTSLSGPDRNWLHLEYDSASPDTHRVTAIEDSNGRRVVYRYNASGQLVEVTYPAGESILYSYDGAQNLLTVSTRKEPSAAPLLLVTNSYLHGRLVRQLLPDGRAYTFAYAPEQGSQVLRVHITRPDGESDDLTFGPGGGAALRRHLGARDATADQATTTY